MLTKQQICDGLKALRASRPEFKDVAVFARKIRVHPPTVRYVEDGRSLPNVLFMEEWVRACGLTLSQFITTLEIAATVTGRAGSGTDPPVKAGRAGKPRVERQASAAG